MDTRIKPGNRAMNGSSRHRVRRQRVHHALPRAVVRRRPRCGRARRLEPEPRARRAAARSRATLDVGDVPRRTESITEMVADPDDRRDLDLRAQPRAHRERRGDRRTRSSRGRGTLKGIACEKPLARNVAEARQVRELVEARRAEDGYLENQLFAPQVETGRALLWARGAATTGRPYLARAAEEHSGPHAPWFWQGELQGGGVLNDMMCHSALARAAPAHAARRAALERAAGEGHGQDRQPEVVASRVREAAPRDDGRGGRLHAPAVRGLRQRHDRVRDERRRARARRGEHVVELRRRRAFASRPSCSVPSTRCSGTRWTPGCELFFSRAVQGKAGEDLVEKQNAETGLMPVVPPKRWCTATRPRTGTSSAPSSARRSRGSPSTTASAWSRC